MAATLNICMTSYPKRIGNCLKVIQSVLENTVLPDRIYLTLSAEEFRNFEQDLPKDLYYFIMTSNKVILNWVKENTKSMKKVFPILQYLEDDDIIIDIDDDMLLPKDFIESRMADFKKANSSSPITSNRCKSIGLNDTYIVQSYSLFTKKMLRNHDKLTKFNEVIQTYNDDRTYLYLFYMNGFKPVPCSKWCTQKPPDDSTPKLDLMPRSDYRYLVGGIYDNAMDSVIKRISNGKCIRDCFGLFSEQNEKEDADKREKDEKNNVVLFLTDNPDRPKIDPQIEKIFQYNLPNPIKHDIVYVLGKGSKHENLEIKISITSMIKFCSDWINNIYVVGEWPRIKNSWVKHIYAPDITKNNKDGNIINKLLTATRKIPTLTENFLFCSDDILVTKKSDWEDFMPRYVFEYNQSENFRRKIMEDAKRNAWDKLLVATLERFVGNREKIYFYEPHIFAPINKKTFSKMCSEIDTTNKKNVIIMSLYFNYLGLLNPVKRYDHQSVFSAKLPNLTNLERHVTYNDKSFGVKEFRDRIIKQVLIENVENIGN